MGQGTRPPVPLIKLDVVSLEKETTDGNETSHIIRERVIRARERQYQRYGIEICNAVVSNKKLLPFIQLSEEQEKMLQTWSSKFNWSTRVQMKIRRLARTIADLNGDENITNESIWEAVTMRRNHALPKQKGMVK